MRGLMGRMMEALVDLVRIATGRRDGQRRARRRDHAVRAGHGDARLAGDRALSLFERAGSMPPDLIAEVKARIAANIDAILDRMIAERQEPQ